MTAEGTILLRPGRAGEAAVLSALALRSKGHWGYDAAFLEACRDELTLTPDDVASLRVTVAEVDAIIAGFVGLSGEPPVGELSHLFVDPPFIGAGIGRLLFDAGVGTGRRAGFAALAVDADPGAEAFYLRMGAIRIGTTPSGSIPDRRLPRLRYDL